MSKQVTFSLPELPSFAWCKPYAILLATTFAGPLGILIFTPSWALAWTCFIIDLILITGRADYAIIIGINFTIGLTLMFDLARQKRKQAAIDEPEITPRQSAPGKKPPQKETKPRHPRKTKPLRGLAKLMDGQEGESNIVTPKAGQGG